MAASMTFEYEEVRASGIQEVIVTWTSSAAGSVSGTTKALFGQLVKGITDPGATAPTANYDIALTDDYGVDVLSNCPAANQLQNRHTTTTECVYFLLSDGTAAIAAHPIIAGVLTVSITNAGDSKEGVLHLYLLPFTA